MKTYILRLNKARFKSHFVRQNWISGTPKFSLLSGAEVCERTGECVREDRGVCERGQGSVWDSAGECVRGQGVSQGDCYETSSPKIQTDPEVNLQINHTFKSDSRCLFDTTLFIQRGHVVCSKSIGGYFYSKNSDLCQFVQYCIFFCFFVFYFLQLVNHNYNFNFFWQIR